MISINYDDIKDNYYTLVSNTKMTKFNNKTFEQYYNQYIKSKLNNYSLKDILIGDYEKLLEIKNSIGTKYNNKNNIIKQFFNYDKALSKNFKPKLSKVQPKISKYIESNLDIHTCYFCNIDFINKFKENIYKKDNYKNSFTLDHFIDKGTYPYLALSLYNLIPSCYTCNTKVKGTNPIKTLSPSSTKFDFDEKVKFTTFLNNKNLEISDEDDFELLLKENFSDSYDSFIKVLKLDERYEYHKYKVIELINKRRDYPDSRISELSKITNKTIQEVKQDLFGEYLSDNLHKRPLSKLIKDISEELQIIKKEKNGKKLYNK